MTTLSKLQFGKISYHYYHRKDAEIPQGVDICFTTSPDVKVTRDSIAAPRSDGQCSVVIDGKDFEEFKTFAYTELHTKPNLWGMFDNLSKGRDLGNGIVFPSVATVEKAFSNRPWYATNKVFSWLRGALEQLDVFLKDKTDKEEAIVNDLFKESFDNQMIRLVTAFSGRANQQQIESIANTTMLGPNYNPRLLRQGIVIQLIQDLQNIFRTPVPVRVFNSCHPAIYSDAKLKPLYSAAEQNPFEPLRKEFPLVLVVNADKRQWDYLKSQCKSALNRTQWDQNKSKVQKDFPMLAVRKHASPENVKEDFYYAFDPDSVLFYRGFPILKADMFPDLPPPTQITAPIDDRTEHDIRRP